MRAGPVLSLTEGTNNRVFTLENDIALLPEVTNYIREMGSNALGAKKLFYVTKCFRNETTTDSERLREFTQIGVELLGENSLDCRKIVRRDAIGLMKSILGTEWKLVDGPTRGLHLYTQADKTFEVWTPKTKKQLLGGGPYEGGAGWALGLERLIGAIV